MKFFDLVQAERFWGFIKPVNSNEFVEIRLTPPRSGLHPSFWVFCRELKSLLPDTPVNKSVCFFIKSFDELRVILSFKNGFFNTHSKICYGVHCRVRSKDGLLNGSYDCVPFYRFVFFDIDTGVLEGFDKELFDVWLGKCLLVLERYGLKSPFIVSSGGGVHLIFRVPRTRVTESRKEWLKFFMNGLRDGVLKNDRYKVDSLTDAPRVAGLVGSWNVKRGRPVSIVKESSYTSSFRIKSKRVPKVVPVEVDVEGLPSVKDSLEFQVLLRVPPEGERHQTLLFSLKLLLKARGVDHRPFESVLNRVYGGSVSLDPRNGTNGKFYNKGIIINYCKKYWSWVEKHPDLVRLFEEYVKKE